MYNSTTQCPSTNTTPKAKWVISIWVNPWSMGCLCHWILMTWWTVPSIYEWITRKDPDCHHGAECFKETVGSFDQWTYSRVCVCVYTQVCFYADRWSCIYIEKKVIFLSYLENSVIKNRKITNGTDLCMQMNRKPSTACHPSRLMLNKCIHDHTPTDTPGPDLSAQLLGRKTH